MGASTTDEDREKKQALLDAYREKTKEANKKANIGKTEDLKTSKFEQVVMFTCPKTISELFTRMKNGKACLDDWKCVLLI